MNKSKKNQKNKAGEANPSKPKTEGPPKSNVKKTGNKGIMSSLVSTAKNAAKTVKGIFQKDPKEETKKKDSDDSYLSDEDDFEFMANGIAKGCIRRSLDLVGKLV